MRWHVERPVPRGEVSLEDVGADTLTIESGVLIFRTGDRIEIAYAPGEWRTVVPEAQ